MIDYDNNNRITIMIITVKVITNCSKSDSNSDNNGDNNGNYVHDNDDIRGETVLTIIVIKYIIFKFKK